MNDPVEPITRPTHTSLDGRHEHPGWSADCPLCAPDRPEAYEPELAHDPDDDSGPDRRCSVCERLVHGPDLFRFALSAGHHACLVRLRAADRLANAALYGTDADAKIYGGIRAIIEEVAGPTIDAELMAHFHVSPHNPDVLHRGPVDVCPWCTQIDPDVAHVPSYREAMGHRPSPEPSTIIGFDTETYERLNELQRAAIDRKIYPDGPPLIEDTELAAIETIVGVLGPLGYSTRTRVMTYLKSRFGG